MQFAQEIVKAVSEISPFPISLSDKQGYIIGDTKANRVGTLHSPSIEVIEKGKSILYSEDKSVKMDNVLPGVAVPLQFNYKIIGVLGIIGNPVEVQPYAILVKKYVEVMWQETYQLQLKDIEEKTIETFLQYVLLSKSLSDNRLKKFYTHLRVNEKLNWSCTVIDIGDALINSLGEKTQTIYMDQLKTSLINRAKKVFDDKETIICGFLNTERIVLLLPVKNENEFMQQMQEFYDRGRRIQELFDTYHIPNTIITSGSSYFTMEDINISYQEAEELIQFAKENENHPKIYTYYDWDTLARIFPMSISDKMQDMLLYRLKPLLDNMAFVDLARDYMTYCECNMNVSKAAKKLYIHRNTLIYRLKKIESITMIKINCFEQCTMLYIILKHISPLS